MAKRPEAESLVGKRLQFDRETWNAVDLLAREQMKDLQELTEEAFRDLLHKYGRTADFREALKKSAAQNVAKPSTKKRRGRRSRSKK
jgi:hypothetical protein